MKIKVLQAVVVTVLLIPLLMQLEYVYENKEPEEKQPLRVVFIQDHAMINIAEVEPYVSEKIEDKRELVSEYYECKQEWKEQAKADHEAYLALLAQQRRAEQTTQVYSEPAPEPTSTAPSDGYLGTYRCTGYVATGNTCANGNYPTDGYTIASNSLPLGTKVYIEGIGERVVEDKGGMSSNVIDIYIDGSTQDALNFGRQNADVYIIEE